MRVCLFLFLLATSLFSADPARNLMPVPAQISAGDGRLVVDQNFRIAFTGYKEPRLNRAAERLVTHLTRKTGIPISAALSTDAATASLEINCEKASLPVQTWSEDESYQLTVTEGHARLSAPNPLGVLHGMETFLQLVELGPDGYIAPAVTINDKPRFPWRGLLLDVCRHWMPLDVVKRQLDAMAAVKMNVFHWHLTDDQGFRIESKRYPLLHQKGSDGKYYAQEQVREVLAYARDRGIRVVPEFDVPGHTSSWQHAYPALASGPVPVPIAKAINFVEPVMDPTKETTYTFLDGFYGEMSKLFPDAYLHIGGDEVNPKQWKKNIRIKKFNRVHHFKDHHDLHAYFNKRLQKIVSKHGKRVMGWDETLHAELPKDIVVQSWRNQKYLARSVEAGYTSILSAGYYLDQMKTAEVHYLNEPFDKEAASLDETSRQRVLGGEACMWTEFASAETVDSRIWPRAAAIAERLWSPADVRDVESMYRRLAIVSGQLDQLGLQHRANYHPMLQRLSNGTWVPELKTLADILEPVKMYQRARRDPPYTTDTPLNRMVDAARPESELAREFNQRAERIASGQGAAGDSEWLHIWLRRWQANDRVLQPTLQQSALLEEIVPVSQDLTTASTIALQALSYLESKQPAPPNWKFDAIRTIESAREAKAEVLLMIVPGARRLVDAVQ